MPFKDMDYYCAGKCKCFHRNSDEFRLKMRNKLMLCHCMQSAKAFRKQTVQTIILNFYGCVEWNTHRKKSSARVGNILLTIHCVTRMEAEQTKSNCVKRNEMKWTKTQQSQSYVWNKIWSKLICETRLGANVSSRKGTIWKVCLVSRRMK